MGKRIKMIAYELADELLRDNTQLTVKSAYMLRQQADRIAELEKQTKSLSDEEILNEWLGNDRNFYYFARAIEERHGIK